MKIRYRLTLWYYAVTFAILLVFSIGIYLGVEQLLYQAFDEDLNIVVESIQRSYDEKSDNFNELNEIPKSINPFADYYLIVYNKSGDSVFSSNLAKRIFLEVPVPKSSIEKGYIRHVRAKMIDDLIDGKSNNGITFRVISHQLFFNNKIIGWVIIGLPINQIQDSMQQLLIVLLFAVFAGLILIGLGGFYLTKKSLAPVDLITRRARQISHSNLTERIEIKNEGDELGQLSVVLNDLLERLHKAFVSQKEFMADVAHELKTPLSILRSHWETEINNPALTLELKEKLVQDVETITRLSHLINNLLLLSKTEAVSTNFEFKTVQLDVILSEVIADAGILAQIKSQEIVTVDLNPAEITGDKLRLYQLFFNLLDNAIKYSPENGKIFISLRIQSGIAVVEIKDNGEGIPQGDISKIFDRFYRVHKDRARRSGGSGLGLSICKLITESHMGTIEVRSEPGKGSSFFVKLPLSQH